MERVCRFILTLVGTVLWVEGLGKRYESRWVFLNLTFALETGQILVVRGRNGSGKSTLLKCLAGLIQPSLGEVSGEPVGYYGLDLALYPDLTPAEHAALIGFDCDFGSVGLEEVIHQKVKEFSTGMRGRAKLALSRAGNPTIWLLDEPTAALDEAGQQALAALVRDHACQGAVIIATNTDADAQWGTHELILD